MKKTKLKKPQKRAREAALRKALIIALRGLPEQEVVNIIASEWLSIHRFDLLQEQLP